MITKRKSISIKEVVGFRSSKEFELLLNSSGITTKEDDKYRLFGDVMDDFVKVKNEIGLYQMQLNLKKNSQIKGDI